MTDSGEPWTVSAPSVRVLVGMTPPRTFLILDDEEDNRDLIRHHLLKGFPGAEIIMCNEPQEALTVAAGKALDAVISDHHLGSGDGILFIEHLREQGVVCPVVMVTASCDPSVHWRAQAAGALRIFDRADAAFTEFLKAAVGS